MHSPVNDFSLTEEIWHAITHGVGFFLSIAALVLLIVFSVSSGSAIHVVAASIYGTSLIILFGSSTLYHALTHHRAKQLLQRFDHAAIYLLIAGSYTPIMLITIGGVWGWTLFSIEWGIAVIGVILKFVYPGRFETLSLIAYVLMGWLIIMVFGEFKANMAPIGFWLMVAGGVAYTGGIFFYLKDRVSYFHAVWHAFVMAGAILQFFAILLYVV